MAECSEDNNASERERALINRILVEKPAFFNVHLPYSFYPQNNPLQEVDKIKLFLFLDEESEPQMAETTFSRSHVSGPRRRFMALEWISVSFSLYSRAWSHIFMNGRLFIIMLE